jgi:glutamate N-acetyltransferase / amino-acid N-acetyltransferase
MIRKISDSSLVKTAMFGRDPNWGRIISAAGNAGLPFNYEKVDLYIGSEKKIVMVLEKGSPLDFDTNFIKKLLRESHIKIVLDLHNGKVKSKGWGSDLTTDYVLFNSVYST